MRILIITNLFPNPVNPTWGTFNFQLFSALARKLELHIFVLVPFVQWCTNWKSFLSVTEYNGLPVTYVCQWYIPKLTRRLNGLLSYFVLKQNSVFKSEIQECGLIFSTWCYPDGWAAGKLANDFGSRHIIKVHGSDVNQYITIPALRVKVIESLKHADLITTVSEDLKKKIIQLGISGNKITTIYSGVDKTIFFQRSKTRCRLGLNISIHKKVILFVGSLKMSKGVGVLIDAFAALLENKRDSESYKLYILGRGRDKKVLHKMVAEYGLGGKVVFVGNVPHMQIPKYICASDLVTLPSFNEGVPNIVLEAQACGRHVVATKIGGIPEVITEGENGSLVPVADVAALSKALAKSLGRKWNGKTIISQAKLGTWEENAEQLVHMMKGLINNH